MSSRKQGIMSPSSSWRMVEGENDSFDTSLVPDFDEEDIVIPSNPSEFSSQGQFSMGSGSQEDNIRFEPSLPIARQQSSMGPSMDFQMPLVDVPSPRRTSTRSSATIRPDESFIRRRQPANLNANPTKWRDGGRRDYRDDRDDGRGVVRRGQRREGLGSEKRLGDRFLDSLPTAVFDTLAWGLGIFGMALGYAQKPLALLLAIYLFFGGLIIAQNMATKSLYASLSPICRIPGTSYLDLPFCPKLEPAYGTGADQHPVEFDGLMNVQDQFERVLEKSASGVSLPMEMKRSETSIRDLRTMVRYSTLRSKDELVLEFDGYIDTARGASNDLQKFNTHVGSAVDAVVSINRWTSRYIDSLAAEENSKGSLSRATSWIFAPFQPAVFSERNILDKYVEHTSLVSDRIASLIVEAQAVLRTLSTAEDHLGIIYDIVTRSQKDVQGRKDEILWTLWTLVGGNSKRLHNLNSQLSLLKQVDSQRGDAVRQVMELIVELEKIQAGLGDLRDRVAEPEIVRDSNRPIPLSVHIETIDRGVERLEEARSRIRAAENERIRQVISRGSEERLIESK